ncbi:MAG: protein translocase subunit SecD [Clostridiales bacterium]|nr:protein translocase subunit SecD [Clostridiales bacterium]
MKEKSPFIFTLLLALIIFLAYLAAFGLDFGTFRILPMGKLIKQGLDLKGGVYVVEEIQDKNIQSDTVDATIQQIKERVDKFGVVDPTIVKEGTRRIRIEIPGISDPQKALELIGKTGNLRFVGPDKSEILTGKDVKNSFVSFDENNQPQVALQLNDSGKTKFADATEKFMNQEISIYLDEDLVQSATVQAHITDGNAVITNMKSNEEATRVASLIKSGALPVTLKAENVRTIGPSLGADALSRSITAGAVGISLVLLFMLLYYRLPGFVADMALVVFILLDLLIFVVFNVTLTLPGISGFLLTIGMAVDANVLIFERIRKELKTGKTLHAALNAGFHRAMTSIIDSNVTTIIAGIVLAILGSGPVKGFAVTLITGVVASMFTAITVTKFLLGLVINIKVFDNPKYFGA